MPSLEEIEGSDWGDASSDATYLVATVHTLRRRQITELTVEDLRILLGRGVGVAILLPIAIDRLESDPFAEGDFYPGDLLVAALRLDLRDLPEQARRLGVIADRLDPKELDGHLRREIAAFRGRGY
jgi:hypothetical protein